MLSSPLDRDASKTTSPRLFTIGSSKTSKVAPPELGAGWPPLAIAITAASTEATPLHTSIAAATGASQRRRKNARARDDILRHVTNVSTSFNRIDPSSRRTRHQAVKNFGSEPFRVSTTMEVAPDNRER